MIKFVFLIPAYNCKKEIKQTLMSVFAQSYDNWRVIFIDDVSTDGTGEYVAKISQAYDMCEKVNIIKREEKYGEVRNTISELASIEDDEIVVRLDGGDWLTDNDTLAMLCQIYTIHNAAVVYTQQRWAFTDVNISGQIELQSGETIYEHPWVSSHLKTFKAKDLKAVPLNNFFDEDGKWIMIACDQAVFLPLIHLAIENKRPVVYFPRCCYHYNIDLEKPNLFTEERTLRQKRSAEWIRARGYVE